MKIRLYDRVKLKSGYAASVVEIFDDGKAFLVDVDRDGDTYTEEESSADLELILKEYGQKHVSTPLAKYYLLEHGETIIADKAVKALAKTLRE